MWNLSIDGTESVYQLNGGGTYSIVDPLTLLLIPQRCDKILLLCDLRRQVYQFHPESYEYNTHKC